MGEAMIDGKIMSGGMIQGSGNAITRSTTTGLGIFNANCASYHGDGGNSVVPSLPIRGLGMLVGHKIFEDFIRYLRMPDGSTAAILAFMDAQISDLQLKSLFRSIVTKFGSGRSKDRLGRQIASPQSP